MSRPLPRFRLPTLLFGLSLAFALAAGVLLWRVAASDFSGPAASTGIGGPFALTDQDRHARTDRDFRGRWMLVYFGYTFCPDVCPTTLQTIADALRGLGPKAHEIVPLFVSVDPARDRPAVLKKYLAAFGPEFVGLTGSPAQIAAVARAYRVYYARHNLPGGAYSIDHADTLYLMTPDGRFDSLLDGHEGAAALKQQLAAKL
ncbi:MAG TPA: SCO family protein [Rhizomicrobium sp.]|jgi:protein SCO1/2